MAWRGSVKGPIGFYKRLGFSVSLGFGFGFWGLGFTAFWFRVF